MTDTRLTQTNGEQAVVESVKVIPYVVRLIVDEEGNSAAVGLRKDVPTNLDSEGAIREYQEGVSVEMTPRIADEEVEIDVSAEVSTHVGYTQNQYGPIIDRKRVHTVASLAPDKPAVIGGLVRETEVEANKGIVGLRRIPYVGNWLFSRKVKSIDRSLIVITIELEHARAGTKAVSLAAETIPVELAVPPASE